MRSLVWRLQRYEEEGDQKAYREYEAKQKSGYNQRAFSEQASRRMRRCELGNLSHYSDSLSLSK